ncbi:hypothetical protein LJR219_004238 [Phenylobacterium sp. LjRoot219]|uniref:hypothetical protein n=1 Tax=Phenylobacterium sp. LjRoot219 TaxID=3342283 RepID=UPI003ECDC8E8
MNDVRNLMSKLGGELDYKEFHAAPAKPQAPWALIERVKSTAGAAPSSGTAEAAESEPRMAIELRKAADARSQRGVGAAGRLSLGQYAAAAPAQPPAYTAGLPLTEVFARLSQGR